MSAARSDDRLILEYRLNVGREPQNLPPDHPDLWQWEYRGTREERAALAEQMGLHVEEETPVIDGQEELF